MTTTIKVNTNGNYVSTIKINGVEAGSVGPGSMVEKSFGLPHNNGGPSVFEVYERPATAEEIEAAKPKAEADPEDYPAGHPEHADEIGKFGTAA